MNEPVHSRDEIFAMIADERRQIAEVASKLTEQQLRTPSLVPTWSVKDVLAHLTMGWEVSVPRFLVTLLMTRSFGKAADKLTWNISKRPIAEIVESLRKNAETKFMPPGAGPETPLTEVIVHGLDFRRPLGIQRQIPEERVRIALQLLFEMSPGGFTRPAWRDGLRFEATDLEWSHGAGPVLRGTAEALLLAVTGRAAILPELTGDGVEVLRERYRAG